MRDKRNASKSRQQSLQTTPAAARPSQVAIESEYAYILEFCSLASGWLIYFSDMSSTFFSCMVITGIHPGLEHVVEEAHWPCFDCVSGTQLNVDIMNARCKIPGRETRATTLLCTDR